MTIYLYLRAYEPSILAYVYLGISVETEIDVRVQVLGKYFPTSTCIFDYSVTFADVLHLRHSILIFRTGTICVF